MDGGAVVGSTNYDWRQAKLRLSLVLFSYCLIAYLVHGYGHDLTRRLLGGGDGYTAGFPSKLFSTTLSAWNPYVQLGQYAFANTQFQPFYPPGLIPLSLFPSALGYDLYILAHYAMAGFFFFCFARNLPLGEFASYFGGVCFMCCGFLLAHKGHQAMLSAAVWLPLILLFVDMYSRSLRAWHAGLGGLALALCILSGFPQITLYTAIVAAFYLGFRCLGHSSRPLVRRLRILVLGLVTLFGLGVLLSSLQLLAVADALPYITRQKISLEMFDQDSLPAYYLGLLFVPNMMGCFYGVPCFSALVNTVELYPYSGLLPLILALFALQRLRRTSREVVFWAIAVFFAAILSLGLGPVQRVLYHVPIYNLFRAPARHLFEITFGICVLAAYGLDALLATKIVSVENPAPAMKRSTVIVGLVVLGIVLALQVLRYVLLHQNQPAFAQIGQRLLRDMYPFADKPGLVAAALIPWRATILYSLLCLAASWFVLSRLAAHRMLALWKTAALSIVLLDVWLPYHMLYDNPDTADLYKPDAAPEIGFIEKQGFDRDHYRLYPVGQAPTQTYPLLNMIHRLSVINDYSPVWLSRFQSVSGFGLNGESPTAMFAPKLMDALGVKYLIVNGGTMAHYLRWIEQVSPSSKAPVPLPAFTCAALACTSAQFPNPETITLGAPNEGDVSIIQIPVALDPNTAYELSFEARSQDNPASLLHIDLYSTPGEWAGLGAGDVQSFVALGPVFTKNSLTLDSGRIPARNGHLRLFTTSKARLEVRNLTLAKIPPGPKAYKEVFGAPNGSIVFENPGALPRFRFATQLVPVAGVSEARAITLASTFDPAKQVTVENLSAPAAVDPGKILSEQIANDSMTWSVETGNRSFFVVADSWFPGWTARVDGHGTDIHIVNGFLRGIFVDGAGPHRIEMNFRPRSVVFGLAATIAGGLLLAGMWLWSHRLGTIQVP